MHKTKEQTKSGLTFCASGARFLTIVTNTDASVSPNKELQAVGQEQKVTDFLKGTCLKKKRKRSPLLKIMKRKLLQVQSVLLISVVLEFSSVLYKEQTLHTSCQIKHANLFFQKKAPELLGGDKLRHFAIYGSSSLPLMSFYSSFQTVHHQVDE